MITAPVHTIVVIESLGLGDKQTGTELYNDIIKRYIEYHKKDINHYFFKPKSKEEFVEVFQFIETNLPYMTLGILVHIESHGLKDKSGLSMADDSIVSWEDLKPHLIKINVATENQLYLTMATCFGRYLHEAIDLKLQSPFSGYISASKKVKEDEIIEDYSPFFEQLISTGDILEAFKILDSRGSNFIYKDVETMYNGLILDWLKNMKDDKEFRDAFLDQIRIDYEEQREDWFPKFDEMPVEEVLEEVKVEFVNKYRSNFLFGKGR